MVMTPYKKSAAKKTARTVQKTSRSIAGKVARNALSKTPKKTARKPSISRQTPTLAEDLIGTIGAGIYRVQKGKFVFVSDIYEKMTGYQAKDIVGKNFLDHVHPDDRPVINRRLKEKTKDPYEYRFIKKDGDIIWLLETSVSVAYQGEKALQGSVMDISRYKQNDESIELKRDRLGAILQDVEDNYYETDLKGSFTFVNDALVRHTGYSRKELIGMNYRRYCDDATAKRMKKLFTALYRTGKSFSSIESQFIVKDGTKRFVEMSGSLIRDRYGKPIGFRGLSKDITERKQMEDELRKREQRYRTILDDMDEGYFEVDLKGNLSFVNDALCRDLGYSPGELIGMNYRLLSHHEETIKNIFQLFSNVYKTGMPVKGLQGQYTVKDGRRHFSEISVSLSRNEKGQPVGFRGIFRNISERKRMEDELRESERKYRTILEDIDECYFETDLKGNMVFGNSAQCRDLGYTLEELREMKYEKYTDESILKETREIFSNIYKTGQPARYEGLYIHKSGKKYYSEVFVSLMRDAQGVPTGFRGLSRNISDRKEMEGALRKSEERYRTILEDMDEGYGELDLTGTWIFVNHAGARNFGYAQQEMIGMNYRNVTDAASAKKMFALFNAVYTTGQPFKNEEVEYVTKDGNRRINEISGALIRDEKGKPVGFRVLSRDVTERKWSEDALLQSEAKYVSIIESIGDSYFETDLRGVTTFVNDKVCQDLGYTRSELLRMSNRDLQDEAAAGETYAVFNKVFETGRPVKAFSYRAIRKDGTRAVYEMSISLMRDASGKPIGFRGLSRDITERKKMEDALRASEEKYRTILESITDGYVEVDLAGNWIFMNDVICEHMQYSREELTRMNFQKLHTKESAERSMKAFTEVFATGKPLKALEVESVHKDGTIGHYELSVSLMKDAQGNPIGFRCISRDIAERKKMETELRQSEEKYRTIIETIQDGYLEIDLTNHYTFVNDRVSEHLGYSREELIGMDGRRIQDDENFKKTRKVFVAVLKTGIPVKAMELDLNRKDGTKGSYELSISLIHDAKGQPAGFRCVSRDITERKKMENELRASEERARNLIAAIPDPYIERDLQGKAVYVNDAYIALTGYSTRELQSSDFSYRQYTDAQNAAIISDTYNAVIKTGMAMKNVELEIITKTGEKRQVNLSATLVRDNQGNPIGVQSIVRDITEKKRAEELIRKSEQSLREYSETLELRVRERTAELEKARVAAEAASRAKSAFLANVSHEFQTPLNAVIGFTKVLQDRMFGELNEKQEEFVRYIADAGASLSKIITEILDVTHVTSKSVKLNWSSISIVDVLKKTTKMLASQIKEKHQTLTVDVDLDADVSIDADEQKIQQIFFHVLSNAVKYSPEDGAVGVHVFRMMHEPTGREGVGVAIQDTGPGIKEEDIPKIFESFSTLESPYTRTAKGIGMGLSLSKQLLELHGGDIFVKSQYGAGSCFTIFLPLKQKQAESMG